MMRNTFRNLVKAAGIKSHSQNHFSVKADLAGESCEKKLICG